MASEFKVKYTGKQQAPSLFEKIKRLYKKYRIWVWAACCLIVVVSIYFAGVIHTFVAVMGAILVLVVISNVLAVRDWLKNPKKEHDRIRRAYALITMAVALIGFGVFVQAYFIHTDAGQSLQKLLYGH